MSLFRNSPYQGVRTIISGIGLVILAFLLWLLVK
jgi:hypothetical protein